MKAKLLITFLHTSDVMAAAAREFDVIREGDETISPARILELANQHKPVAILIGNGQKLSEEEIARLPETVKIIATSSVGFDHLNLSALSKRGIFATNTPDVLSDATADLTMLLLLSACRRAREYLAITSKGWGFKLGQGETLGIDLKGKRLGIYGMGRIGQAFAKRARAFGMEVMYCNRRRLAPELENGARFFSDLEAMLPHCQVLSLHAPGTSETESRMGPKEFALLPKDSVFINVARGSLVDEEALFSALSSGHLFAAGLDVCRNEPNPDPRFLTYPNVTLFPHVGSATRETRNDIGYRALENIRMALNGLKPRDLLET